MKKVIFLMFAFAIMGMPEKSYAYFLENVSPYTAFRSGFGLGDSYAYLPESSGFGGMIAAGAQYSTDKINWRIEIEISKFKYKNNEYEDKNNIKKYTSSYKLNNNLYLTNFNFEVLKDYKIQMFSGLALGIASFTERVNEETYVYLSDRIFKSEYESSNTAFAMGLNVGIGFKIIDEFYGEIGGRCIEFATGHKIRVCDATLGLRYNF